MKTKQYYLSKIDNSDKKTSIVKSLLFILIWITIAIVEVFHWLFFCWNAQSSVLKGFLLVFAVVIILSLK